MQHERLTQTHSSPGTQHRQGVNPAGIIAIGTQRDSSYAFTLEGQEPQGGIKVLTLDRPVFPFLEVARHMPPVILESLIIGIEDQALVAPAEGTHGDPRRPFRLRWSFLHLNLHVPRTTNLFEALPLQALSALLIVVARPA